MQNIIDYLEIHMNISCICKNNTVNYCSFITKIVE